MAGQQAQHMAHKWLDNKHSMAASNGWSTSSAWLQQAGQMAADMAGQQAQHMAQQMAASST